MATFRNLAFLFALIFGLIAPQISCGGGGGGGDTKPNPPQTYTATFQLGAGITMAQTSYSYTSGTTVSFTFAVAAGHENPAVAVTSGTGSATLTSGASGTFTGTSNLTIVLNANVAPVAEVPVVAFVVSPEIMSAMSTLIADYRQALVSEGWETILITDTTTPVRIREQLKDVARLKCALLIGNIPIVKKQKMPSGTVWHAWEHYYSGLNYTYKDPVLDSDGYWRLPDEYLFLNSERSLPEFCPTITVSRILGPSPANIVSDVRTYIEKNLRLRGNVPAVGQGLSYIESFDYGTAFDTAAVQSAYANHPLGTFTLKYDATGATSKSDFLSALGSADYVRVSAHGGVTGFDFNSASGFDSRTEVSSNLSPRLVHIDTCDGGDIGFFVDPYTHFRGESSATRFLTTGNTLLVYAATDPILGVTYASAQRALFFDYGLGMGHTPAILEPITHLYHGSMAFFGDPTIRMRTNTSSQARMQIGGMTYPSSFSHTLSLATSNVSGVSGEIEIKNTGSTALVVNGVQYREYTTTAQIDQGSGGRWLVSGYDGLVMGKYGTVSIAPGSSKKLVVQLNRLDHGNHVASGAHTGYFHFVCNDPRVGAFRVKATGTLP